MFSHISAIPFVDKAVMMGRYSWSCIHKTSTVAYIMFIELITTTEGKFIQFDWL